MPSYRKLQLYAIWISILSVIYNGAEGAVSIAFGAETASKALVFFGIQSGIEVASAMIVVWRFRNVAKPGEERAAKLDERSLRFERTATYAIGVLLIILGLATIATSISSLVLHETPEASNASIIISASALVCMVVIWLPKRYLARELNSSTMQGEATCSLSCIQITTVLFIGSLIYRVWHGGWWIDSATSMILGLMFGWEGVKMVRWARNPEFDGGCCGECRAPGDIEAGKIEEKGSKCESDEEDDCKAGCCQTASRDVKNDKGQKAPRDFSCAGEKTCETSVPKCESDEEDTCKQKCCLPDGTNDSPGDKPPVSRCEDGKPSCESHSTSNNNGEEAGGSIIAAPPVRKSCCAGCS